MKLDGITQQRTLSTVVLTKYYAGDLSKKNQIVSSCSTYGKEESFIQGFGE